MRAFGFSAFVKLLCLNDRPQRREVRGRLIPSGEAYDYHRSLRLRVQRLLIGGEPLASVLASIDDIRRASEQASVRTGLERLAAWREANPGALLAFGPATYESPARIFKVKYAPDFGLRMGGQGVAIHIWNNATPRLQPRMVYAALALIQAAYDEAGQGPDDIALLSLPDMTLYRLSEAGRTAGIAAAVAARIEEVIREESDGLGLPSPDQQPGRPPR